jgi:RHS repeat-associated protein
VWHFRGGSTKRNGFDALNRVNAENPGSSISYTYDATSNRLTKVSGGTTTTTVPSTSNKISAVGSNSYTYDSSGNITADGVNTYTWNAEGELSVVKVGGSPVGTYTYNFYRQRADKVAASTAYYVYGAGGLVYGEYDTSGNFIREYVYLNGAPLAQIDTGSPEVLTYLHTDHLGTPRFGTNSSSTQVWSWNNDTFGTSTPSGTATVNLRMAGQYFDSESDLFYNWNRVYNPAIGRYISSDPIGIVGGLNTYGYLDANPLSSLDPPGLDDLNHLPWKQIPAITGTASTASIIDQRATFSAQNPVDVFSVAAHGGIDPTTDEYTLFDEFGNPISASQLIQEIQSNPNYVPGEPVLLDVCNEGGRGNGYAGEVAAGLHASVIFPTDFIQGLYVAHNLGGGYEIDVPEPPIVGPGNNGQWNQFNSNGTWEQNVLYPPLRSN